MRLKVTLGCVNALRMAAGVRRPERRGWKSITRTYGPIPSTLEEDVLDEGIADTIV